MYQKIKIFIRGTFIFFLKISGKKIVHFIHIGKTGGTAIKNTFYKNSTIFNNISIHTNLVFVMHSHNFKLDDIKKNEFCFFVVRDPIKRFVSGFSSRKRMGKPAYNNKWTPNEKIAFDTFKSPEELAYSLSNPDKEIQKKAISAMKNIGHVNSSYWNWFDNKTELEKKFHKIFYVLQQENLEKDLKEFKEKYNLKIGELPTEDNKSHKSPKMKRSKLSDRSIENLHIWYKKEYDFCDYLFNKSKITNKYD